MQANWIADRMHGIQASGIRKVFDLARSLKDPINLSIGQPHFDVPDAVKAAACSAIQEGRNGYTVTQGIPELRERILADVQRQYPGQDRRLFVTSGTSGGLVLTLLATVNPGDEVIVFDPFFVMYPHLVHLAGGKTVYVDTYPRFEIDLDRVRAAITPRTKLILFNSPANPTGSVPPREQVQALAELARERSILLVSDEIYRSFAYDRPFTSPAEFNPDVLVLDGFSKTYGMTGWRLGYAHGPQTLIEEMTKLQQFTFVCAPSMVQFAGVAALDCPVAGYFQDYQRKRDRVYEGLKDCYEIVRPGGAFYFFIKTPWGSGTDFVAECIRNNLLLIPGSVFSRQDTHFRLSYAAEDRTLDRGIEVLRKLARRPAGGQG